MSCEEVLQSSLHCTGRELTGLQFCVIAGPPTALTERERSLGRSEMRLVRAATSSAVIRLGLVSQCESVRSDFLVHIRATYKRDTLQRSITQSMENKA